MAKKKSTDDALLVHRTLLQCLDGFHIKYLLDNAIEGVDVESIIKTNIKSVTKWYGKKVGGKSWDQNIATSIKTKYSEFSGSYLYDLHNGLTQDKLSSKPRHDDTISKYLGFTSFADFKRSISDKIVIDLISLCAKYKKEIDTVVIDETAPESTAENDDYLGHYSLYYLRPEKDKNKVIAKGVVQISRKGSGFEVKVWTPSSIEKKSNGDYKYLGGVYEGTGYSLNDEVLHFQVTLNEAEKTISEFSFYLSFDRIDGKIAFQGVYSGLKFQPSLTPINGYAILVKEETTGDIELTGTDIRPDSIYYFSVDSAHDYLFNTEQSDSLESKIFKKLVWPENKVIIDQSTLDFFQRNPGEFIGLLGYKESGDTSEMNDKATFYVFSLKSNLKCINVGMMRVDKFGRVEIKGSKDKGKVRRYFGQASRIGDRAISISAKLGDDSDLINYQFWCPKELVDYTYNPYLINGLRIKTGGSSDGTFVRPFSGRVILCRVTDTSLYDDFKGLEKIPLSPRDKTEFMKYSEAKQLYPHIFKVLSIGENNVVTVFNSHVNSAGLAKNIGHYFKRLLDYKQLFMDMAEYYLSNSKPSDNEIQKLIYFTHKQGAVFVSDYKEHPRTLEFIEIHTDLFKLNEIDFINPSGNSEKIINIELLFEKEGLKVS